MGIRLNRTKPNIYFKVHFPVSCCSCLEQTVNINCQFQRDLSVKYHKDITYELHGNLARSCEGTPLWLCWMGRPSDVATLALMFLAASRGKSLVWLANVHASLSSPQRNTWIVVLTLVKTCDLSLFAAQERWRPLLQLHSPSHSLLREARSAHPSRIQYPSPCWHQKTQHISDFSVPFSFLWTS